VRRFGAVWATMCTLPGAPGWTNLVAPLTVADVGVLPDVFAWYGDLRPQLEATPVPGHEKLARALAAEGAVQTGFIDILYGPARDILEAPADANAIEVSLVGAGDAMLFVRTLLDGHGGAFSPHEVDGLASLVGADGLRWYLARIDGEPVAAAMLSFDDSTAYLANASTLPAQRNRGCHSALLRARLRDAEALGCAYVVGLAQVASTSHRNMEHVGLRTLVTVACWTFPHKGEPASEAAEHG
jgi:ribosomal protein S18 acetylase RimI-like enzyme